MHSEVPIVKNWPVEVKMLNSREHGNIYSDRVRLDINLMKANSIFSLGFFLDVGSSCHGRY